jgi:hypothetical protein
MARGSSPLSPRCNSNRPPLNDRVKLKLRGAPKHSGEGTRALEMKKAPVDRGTFLGIGGLGLPALHTFSLARLQAPRADRWLR